MASFDAIEFAVVADGGAWPLPARDDQGIERYRINARFAELADQTSLYALLTIVTWKRVLGTRGYVGHIEGGPGAKVLVRPNELGEAVTRAAVLVAMTDRKINGRVAGRGLASLEFVLL